MYIVSGLTGFYKYQMMGICIVNTDRTIFLLSSIEFNLATEFPVFLLVFSTFSITTYKKKEEEEIKYSFTRLRNVVSCLLSLKNKPRALCPSSFQIPRFLQRDLSPLEHSKHDLHALHQQSCPGGLDIGCSNLIGLELLHCNISSVF